ncbi:MAG: TlpA family protein disulfide reductase [Kiritimatiellae bacterium]|nr:TlpA family protein disulfide reductase [Kiritimatiellia bacterium]
MNTKQFRIAAAVTLTAMVVDAGAAGWRNIDDAHHLGGRRASEGYMKGKVVLVDRWGAHCPPCRKMLPQVERIWQSFKTKSFVVLGGHCAGWGTADEVRRIVDENKLTYPVYEDAGLAEGEPQFNAIPFLYVVDETGIVAYKGHSERAATQAIVTALTDMDAPRDVGQWRRFLDFELKELPGKAYLRLEEFSKKFPQEAKEYAEAKRELERVPDIKELVELVKFAKQAKDMPVFDEKRKDKKQKFAKMVEAAIAKYAPLKESKDLRVAQEAKNAIADLKWTQAAL